MTHTDDFGCGFPGVPLPAVRNCKKRLDDTRRRYVLFGIQVQGTDQAPVACCGGLRRNSQFVEPDVVAQSNAEPRIAQHDTKHCFSNLQEYESQEESQKGPMSKSCHQYRDVYFASCSTLRSTKTALPEGPVMPVRLLVLCLAKFMH